MNRDWGWYHNTADKGFQPLFNFYSPYLYVHVRPLPAQRVRGELNTDQTGAKLVVAHKCDVIRVTWS